MNNSGKIEYEMNDIVPEDINAMFLLYMECCSVFSRKCHFD